MRKLLWASSWAAGLIGLGLISGLPVQASPTFKTLYEFCSQAGCTDGINPEAGLVRDSGGNLYGTTIGGGGGFGTVFELVHGTTFKQLYRFCSQEACTDGVSPRGALIVDTAGNLYGTASGGGANGAGVAFELAKNGSSWTLHVLHDFCSEGGSACSDGSQPSGTDVGASGSLAYAGETAGQLYDGSSPLYGTTESGGANNSGVVFALTLAAGTWTESVAYSFCAKAACADGASAGNLVAKSDALLYGTTALGDGSVFQLKFNAKKKRWKLVTLYGFCKMSGCADGDVPSGLTMGGSGTLFGTTFGGGFSSTFCFFSSGCGTVFSLLPHGKHSRQSVLYNFCSISLCPDGAQPEPGLAIDSSGALYGATNTGGSDLCFDGCGTTFKLQGTTETVLHTFCTDENCTEGTSPGAGVILDTAGNVFGTTDFGGATGGGTVYEITPGAR
jgi:uncharacterized repeat protein (TIGR03803 family)